MSYELALPKGALILVTGANGYIASHVANELIAAGYRVRGTSRDEAKAQTIATEIEKRHGKGVFESAIVSDFGKSGAFSDAIKGVQGVAHVATDSSFGSDPNVVIKSTVDGLIDLLKVAKAEPSVKRFVLTSSTAGAEQLNATEKYLLNDKSWNEAVVELAWAPPPYTPERGPAVYAASKIEGERAAWKFVEEEKPNFVFNAVVPDFNFGPRMFPGQWASTGSWIEGLFNGDPQWTQVLLSLPPNNYVDVRDTAKLHVAALTHQDVANERLFGLAGPFGYPRLIEALQQMDTSKTFPPSPNDGDSLSILDDGNRAEDLIKRFSPDGWVSPEASIKELFASA